MFLTILTMPVLAFGQWKTSTPSGANTPNNNTGGYYTAQSSSLPDGGIVAIVKNVMNWLLVLLGIFGVIGFVISGIFYLTAAGNEDQMKKGKNAMTWSIIGIVVGLMGYVIIKAADSMLKATAGF
ncbi:MAG: pilin [Candidatus Moraniibacteriota bacterium]